MSALRKYSPSKTMILVTIASCTLGILLGGSLPTFLRKSPESLSVVIPAPHPHPISRYDKNKIRLSFDTDCAAVGEGIVLEHVTLDDNLFPPSGLAINCWRYDASDTRLDLSSGSMPAFGMRYDGTITMSFESGPAWAIRDESQGYANVVSFDEPGFYVVTVTWETSPNGSKDHVTSEPALILVRDAW